jgi:hypothetical protein
VEVPGFVFIRNKRANVETVVVEVFVNIISFVIDVKIVKEEAFANTIRFAGFAYLVRVPARVLITR